MHKNVTTKSLFYAINIDSKDFIRKTKVKHSFHSPGPPSFHLLGPFAQGLSSLFPVCHSENGRLSILRMYRYRCVGSWETDRSECLETFISSEMTF